MSLSPDAIDAAARTLVGRLKGLREREPDASEEKLRQELEREVGASLAGLSPDDARRATTAARDLLREEARGRTAPQPGLRERVNELEAKLAAAEAEARKAREQAGRAVTTGASPAAGSSPTSDGRASSRGVSPALQRSLRSLAAAPEAELVTDGLTSDERALLASVQPLLRFAVDVRSAVRLLMQDFQMGAAAKMSSVMLDLATREVPERFASAMAGDAAALNELQSALTAGREELIELSEALTTCIPRGARALLKELDPDAIGARNKGMLGRVDQEKAWEDYVHLHAELQGLGPSEVWERLFRPHLRALPHAASKPSQAGGPKATASVRKTKR